MTPIVLIVEWKRTQRSGLQKQVSELSRQFLDAMRVVSTALLAGLSMENAWIEAQKEVELLYGDRSCMFLELQEMNRSIELNVPLEKLLVEFGGRSGIEDIISFSEVFAFAKRCGGDLVRIIGETTEHMRSKQETEKEIEVLVAAKKLEQKVMNLVPILILAYLKLGSGDYLRVLYDNPIGKLFMCGCLLAYLLAIYIAEHVLAIRI